MGKKGKQEELPGMEARDVPEIEQAAENYRKIRDERCELSKRESEAKAALIQVLKNLGRSFYQYNGLRVQLEITDNVKVRASDDGDEEPTGTFKQSTRRKQESAEQQQAEAEEYELQEDGTWKERERLHREAVANWRREPVIDTSLAGDFIDESDAHTESLIAAADEAGDKELQVVEGEAASVPGLGRRQRFIVVEPEAEGRSGESEEDEDEGFHPGFPPGFDPDRASAGLAQAKEEGIYVCQGCGAEVEIDLSPTDGLCSRCWTPEAIKDPEERAAFIAENSDDFTAPRCDECKRTDGAHTKECSKSGALRYEDYLAYTRANYKSNHQSYARKMELLREPATEAMVREWMAQQRQAGNDVEVEPEPKKKGRKKLSPDEAAIDR